MNIRSKILAAVAGIAAICAAVVATPGQGSQAHAGVSFGPVGNSLHFTGP